MATYVNDLRLKEISTGDESGTWGTSTNTSLELIGEALGYATQQVFGSDADATTTIADGASDPARAMYFKITSAGSLTATRTCTIAPNTVSRVMFIENATSGSQSIAISQGSGANVTIATGKTAVVYLDGAGSGAAVVDAMAGVDPGVTDTLTEVLVAGNTSGGTNIELSTTDKVQFRDTGIYINSSVDGQLDIVADTEIQIAATTIDINGAINASGEIIAASLDISGDIDVDGTTNLDVVDIDGAVDMASTLAVGGVVTANAGVVVDNITIDGTTIALSSGDLTLDVAGDIILDADGGDIILKDGGTSVAEIDLLGGNLILSCLISDEDILFKGNDGGSTIDALVLDMSAAGAATFNGSVLVPNKIEHVGDADTYLQFSGADDWRVVTGNVERFSANNGAVVVNEESADLDFRVESNANANMLFVDGGNSRVGIGTSPTTVLDVYSTSADADGILRVYLNTATSQPTMQIRQRGEGGSQNTNQGLLIDIAGHNDGNGYILNTSVTNSNINGGVAISPFSVKGIGTFQFRQGGVINENGADSDFRVESDGNANMLFVDGGNNRVGIGTGAPTAPLTVLSTGWEHLEMTSTDSNSANKAGYVTVSHYTNAEESFGVISGQSTASSNILNIGGGAAGLNAATSINLYTTANNTTTTGTPRVSIDSGGKVGIGTGANIDEMLHVEKSSGTTLVKTEVASGSVVGYEITKTGASTANWRIVDGQVVNAQLEIYDVTNSRSILNADSAEVVINDTSADLDFRVESDSDANMLFVDASTSRVGVGTAAPANTFEVNGSASFGNTSVDNSIVINGQQDGTVMKFNAGGSHRFDLDCHGTGTDYLSFNDTDATKMLTIYRSSEVVVNEGSTSSIDFRVESDSNANMLTVDASANAVGIGTSAVTSGFQLGVQGSSALGDRESSIASGGYLTELSGLSITDGSTYYGSYGQLNFHANNAYTASARRWSITNGYRTNKLAFIVGNTDSTSQPILNAAGGEVSNGIVALVFDNVGGAVFNEDSADADFRVESDSNAHCLFVDAGEDQVKINTSASLYTGTQKGGLQVLGGGGGPHVFVLKNLDTSGGANMVRFTDGSGDTCGEINSNATTNTTTYGTSSDYRLKENVSAVSNAIDKVKLLQPKTYNFISDPENIPQDGFLAHELAEVIPAAVTGEKDAVNEDNSIKTQQVDYGQLTPILTAALQEALTKIETLEARIAALES